MITVQNPGLTKNITSSVNKEIKAFMSGKNYKNNLFIKKRTVKETL